MFPQSFSRILWKEYRVHRPLWLACLAIGFTLQFCFVLVRFMTLDQNMNSGIHEIDLRRPLAIVAIMLPIMYSVGCAAVLFAGEREERTTDWLLALASAASLDSSAAKLVFAIASIVGLQCILLFPALLFAGHANDQVSNLEIAPPFALVAFVWAVLGSLLSRRVLISIVAMVVVFALTVELPVSLIRYVVELIYGPIFAWRDDWTWPKSLLVSIFALVIVGDLYLGWRWCQGKYLDGSMIEPWNVSFSKLIAPGLYRTNAVSRSPVGLEFEQLWRRTWQRLIWQERRRERGHLFIAIAGILLAASFALSSRLNRDVFMIPAFAFTLAIPLAMGVLAFRSDSSWQQPRFLCNRGIAPGSVWLVKQFIWLPRAFVITTVIFLASLFSEWMLVDRRSGDVFSTLPFTDIYNFIRSQPSSEIPTLAVWYILLGYCSGQLAACVIRRVVIAALVGIVLNILMWAWLVSAHLLNLPLSCFVGLPLVAMLGITLWQTKPWMMEDYSWKRFSRLTITLAALPLVLPVLILLYRSVEISPARVDNTLVELWRSSRSSVTQPLSTNEKTAIHRLMELSNGQSTDEIVTLLQRDLTSLHEVKEPWGDSIGLLQSQRITGMLRQRAKELETSGEFQKAFDCLLADLRLNRLMAHRNRLSDWRVYSQLQRQTLDLIVELANHPGQTVESIREVARIIDDELNRFPAASEAVVASYDEDDRKWLSPSLKELLRNIQEEVQSKDKLPLLAYVTIAVLREPRRLKALVTRESQLAFSRAVNLEDQFSSPVNQKPTGQAIQSESDDAPFGNSIKTSLLMRFTSHPSWKLSDAIYGRIAMKRATSVRLAMISYRIEHGQLPEKLIDLGGSVKVEQLIDPYSNRLFEYYPAFLLSAGEETRSLRLTSSTDAEVSRGNIAGPVRFTIKRLTSTAPDDVASIIETLTETGLISGCAYPIPPANGGNETP